LSARTPQEAIHELLEHFKVVVGCITEEGFVSRCGRHLRDDLTANFQDYFTILDRRNDEPLKLEVRHRYTVLQVEGDRGLWSTHTTEYIYEVSAESDGLIAAWHWHPGSGRPGDEAHWPHLHAYGDRETLTLHKLHLPTGRVSLEALVRFLIEDLSVVPRRDDWRTVLSRHEEAFRQVRSWA
jgi:hypothetical protein